MLQFTRSTTNRPVLSLTTDLRPYCKCATLSMPSSPMIFSRSRSGPFGLEPPYEDLMFIDRRPHPRAHHWQLTLSPSHLTQPLISTVLPHLALDLEVKFHPLSSSSMPPSVIRGSILNRAQGPICLHGEHYSSVGPKARSVSLT